MPPSRVILDGVDRYRVSEAMFEGLRVVLSYLGEPYSPAYIQGISGAAFVIAGPAPAPTCGHDIGPPLAHSRLPGRGYPSSGTATAPRSRPRSSPAKDELAQRPVLVWNAFTAEGTWSAARWTALSCRPTPADDYARAPDRMLTGCDGFCARRHHPRRETGTFDPRATELMPPRAVQLPTPEDRLPEADRARWVSGASARVRC